MDPSNGLFYDTGSFSHCHNPHRFLQLEVLRLYFPMLEPYVAWSVSLPSCPSWFIRMWDNLVCQPPPCHASSLPWLSIFAPPTSMNECFFLNSLVVGLPYSLIFWQFLGVGGLKFVVVLLLVVRGIEAYPPMPPSL